MADAQQTLTQASIQQVIVGGLPGPGAGSQAALTNAQDAVDSARGAVNRAQGEVDQRKQQALRLLDEFDAVRGKAAHGLISAIQSMPQNEETLPQTKLNKVIDSHGPGIVHAFENLPPDSANVARHRDLKDLAQLGADLGTVAGTIGLAAAIALCPADALGLGPAAAALDATTTRGRLRWPCRDGGQDRRRRRTADRRTRRPLRSRDRRGWAGRDGRERAGDKRTRGRLARRRRGGGGRPAAGAERSAGCTPDNRSTAARARPRRSPA